MAAGSVRVLRRRIRTTRSTMKITKAMELVATSRIAKAQERVTASRPYAEQTYLDAFSSTDLITWTKHPSVLTTANVTWARYAVWAPAPIARNGKYYLYFGANDIQSNAELGGK